MARTPARALFGMFGSAGVVASALVVASLLGCDEKKPAASLRITAEAYAEATGAKAADPTPKAGTVVLGKQPLELARAALAPMTASDPVRVTVLSYGRDSEGNLSLNFTVKNIGACTVTALSGVAYGFDARGHAAAVNAGGETYVAFAVDKQSIEKGATAQLSVALHHVPTASIGVAHIDATTCDDGTAWSRP